MGDDIEVYSDEDRSEILASFINLRSQVKKSDMTPNLCLAAAHLQIGPERKY